MSKIVKIGSRGSDLALWQAHFFQNQLSRIGVKSEIIIITTKGDRIQDLSFDKIEGKGFFTKEIEEALLNNAIDVAIHSHKDLETKIPPGLQIAGVSYREDPSELLLINEGAFDASQPLWLKEHAVVGTSSARRKGQVTSLRPDVIIKDIRGNVPTRVNKLRSGEYDAILLAFAGVHRLKLDLTGLHAQKLNCSLFIPAPAQGVLAYQCRADDHETASIINALHQSDVEEEIAIERSILSQFGGGCHIPIGAHVSRNHDSFTVRVSFADAWEKINRRVRFEAKTKEEALSIFNKLKLTESLPRSVFISRTLSESSYFLRACKANGVALENRPLIETKAVPFAVSPINLDWVFFSSTNAVHHFFSQVNLAEWQHLKFGAVGEGTAISLSNYVSKVDFIGTESDMHAVAADFKIAAGEDRVLFPSSSISLHTISSALPSDQVELITCYETKLVPHQIEPKGAYVFTSPSNVDSFFKANNKIAEKAIVVAIGKSTQSALQKHSITALTAEIPHEAELFALLAS